MYTQLSSFYKQRIDLATSLEAQIFISGCLFGLFVL